MTYNLFIMNAVQNVIEYYDELYPVKESQKKFYSTLIENYPKPVKFLRVGCGTGYFEHLLARDGHDVTGIEFCKELLESANLKRRNQLMSIRFFQMTTLEMTRFLGKGFYNVISCLHDRIIFIHDKTLLRKFFFDCKQLLKEDGKLVIQVNNYGMYDRSLLIKLPEKESIRTKLYTEIIPRENGEQYLSQELETGNGKILPVVEEEPVYTIDPEEIRRDAEEAGFTKCEFYADFEKNPFVPDESRELIAVFS